MSGGRVDLPALDAQELGAARAIQRRCKGGRAVGVAKLES